jgi:3'-phosphoadenosine 5'-phosphosulfate sulfotransferase (PAPS reductase)/FAD synthetase
MFPSPQYRQCTSDLKRGPIDKFIRSLPHKVIVNCMGIRSEESRPRSRLSPLDRNEALSTQRRTVCNWLPIFDRTLSDVLAWHWANAIRLHPVYVPEYHKDGTTGGYLRRFSCRVCIFSTDADLVAIHQHDSSAFHAVASLERKLKFTMRPGAGLVQICGSTRLKEQRGTTTTELLFLTETSSATQNQLSYFAHNTIPFVVRWCVHVPPNIHRPIQPPNPNCTHRAHYGKEFPCPISLALSRLRSSTSPSISPLRPARGGVCPRDHARFGGHRHIRPHALPGEYRSFILAGRISDPLCHDVLHTRSRMDSNATRPLPLGVGCSQTQTRKRGDPP